MDPYKPREDPLEIKIRESIINMLKIKGWFVIIIHGSTFQPGLPDLYAHHRSYGYRWIEVKRPEGYKFTAAQMKTFPEMAAAGCVIHVLTGAKEEDYDKLFKPANWYFYLGTMK